jgi:transcriptional regulator with XRE-family HTH domain
MILHVTSLVELTPAELARLRQAGAGAGGHKLVARALGIAPRTLFSYEYGERRPSLAMLERWCALLGVSELDLRCGQ